MFRWTSPARRVRARLAATGAALCLWSAFVLLGVAHHLQSRGLVGASGLVLALRWSHGLTQAARGAIARAEQKSRTER